MDNRRLELKQLKKACMREKRRYVTGWKTGTIVLLVTALLSAPLSIGAKVYDNAAAAVFGGSFRKLTHADSSANAFSMDYAGLEELRQAEEQLSKQVQAEGAVLLKNENQALPLQTGTQVNCFFSDGKNPVLTEKDNLKTALEKVDISVNGALWDTCRKDIKNQYADALLDTVRGTAIAVLTCGETGHELLQKLSQLKQEGKLQKIIVLLCSEVLAEADCLKESAYGVDGALWIGDRVNTDTVAEILAGQVNPCGNLPYTVCNASAGQVFASTGDVGGICKEGIYTDYKYYETRYEDYVMGTGNAGAFSYGAQVGYPFGHGLSYTTFAFSDMAVVYDAQTDRFAVSVTVSNTGTVAGKKVVQVYGQAPYTEYDKQHGVEKAAVNLVGFAKTGLLEPGAGETVTVYVDKRDLASYDAYGAGTYILDAGAYCLTVASDAHEAVNNILAVKGGTVETTQGRMTADGNASLVYKWEQDAFDGVTYSTAPSGLPIGNRLTYADLTDGEEGVKWLSRRDWEETLAAAVPQLPLQEQKTDYSPGDYATVPMPTTGAQNGLKLYDLVGADFDDPKWQTLLDQLTFADMAVLVGDGYLWTMPAQSVQAPGAAHKSDVGFAGDGVLAATFDTGLAQSAGKVLGNRCLTEDIAFLYRSGGYARDGFLSGKLRAAEALGMQAKGVDMIVKDFAPGEALWCSEQAARERYLRSVQYAVEDGRTGVLLGSTRWGAVEAGRAEGLLSGIMRQEWGSKGLLIAENVSAALGVLAGASACGDWQPGAVEELRAYENDPVIVTALRQACHYSLYAQANGAAMNGVGAQTTVEVRVLPLVIICGAIAAVSGAAALVFAVFWSRGVKKWRRTGAYLDYRTLYNTLKEEKK